MKKLFILSFVFLIVFTFSFNFTAADVLYSLINEDQDSLVIVRVNEIMEEGGLLELEVKELLSGSSLNSPFILEMDQETDIQVNKEDILLVSIDKGGIFSSARQVKWGVFKLSSADYQQLEVLEGPLSELDLAALQHYLNSGGQDSDFYFETDAVYLRKPEGEDVLIHTVKQQKQASSLSVAEQEFLQLKEGETVFHKVSRKDELILKDGAREIVISDNYPSRPIISPDKSKMLYIEPFEFEKLGELFIYDVKTDISQVLFGLQDIGEQNTVKNASWINDRYIMVIAGFGYGTVSVGGDVYLLDVENGEFKEFYSPEMGQEVKEVEVREDEIILKIAVFDDEYIGYSIVEKKLTKEEVLKEAARIGEKDLQDQLLSYRIQLDLLYEVMAPSSHFEAVNNFVRGVILRNGPLQFGTFAPHLKANYSSFFADKGWITDFPENYWANDYSIEDRQQKEEGLYQYLLQLNFKNEEQERFAVELEIEVEQYQQRWYINSIVSDSDLDYLNIK